MQKNIIIFVFFFLCLFVQQILIGTQRFITSYLLGRSLHDMQGNRIQVKVPSQSRLTDGAASCGYQALYNGLAIKDLITNDDVASSLERLRSPEERNRHFGSNTMLWRQPIAIERTKHTAKNSIEEQLIPCFRGYKSYPTQFGTGQGSYVKSYSNNRWVAFHRLEPQWKSEELDILFTLITNVARDLSKEYRVEHDALIHRIPGSLFEQKLQTEIGRRLNADTCEYPLIYSALNDPNHLRCYLDFRNTTCSVPLDPGDWLEQAEIETTIDRVAGEARPPIFIIGGQISADQPLTQDGTIQSDDFRRYKRRFQTRDQNTLGIFLLYIKEKGFMERAGTFVKETKNWVASLIGGRSSTEAEYYEAETASNTGGHWFCLVANKVGNQTQYVLADSLGDTLRMDNSRVLELIELLEGESSTKPNETNGIGFAQPSSILNTSTSATPPAAPNHLQNHSSNIQTNTDTSHIFARPKVLLSMMAIGSIVSYGIYRRYYRSDTSNTSSEDTNHSTRAFPPFLI